jgi:hypothetical protein
MAERRIAVKPIDPNAAGIADAALFEETGGAPITEDQDELQKKWMDAYIAAGGKVKAIKTGGGGPGSLCVPCSKTLTLTGVALEFLSDHDLLKDEEKEWTDTGTLFTPPDWTPGSSNPISHSMGEKIVVRVSIGVDGKGGPETGRLVGKLQGRVIFRSPEILFRPGVVEEITIKSDHLVTEKVREQHVDLVWRVETEKSYRSWTTLFTSSNRWFTTIDRPRNPENSRFGVTLKRMSRAVEQIGIFGTTDSLEIVRNLMHVMPNYTLTPDPAAVGVGHPGYHLAKAGGAWAHMDHLFREAECQAIVRLIQKLLNQVGAPGKTELRLVYADPKDPTLALEDDETAAEPGLLKTMSEDKTTVTSLVDQRLSAKAIGLTFPPSHHVMPDGRSAPGFNAFEACLRFTTPGGTAVYFPGGMGGEDLPSAQAVMDHAFQTMAVIESSPWKDPVTGKWLKGRKVIDILWDYPSGTDTPPPG